MSFPAPIFGGSLVAWGPLTDGSGGVLPATCGAVAHPGLGCDAIGCTQPNPHTLDEGEPMTVPTPETRLAVTRRDNHKCVACNSTDLTFQHRRAVGMGGSKNIPTAVDGLTLCGPCNAACEGSMQTRALAYGWKVRRWVTHPELVPVFYPTEGAWFRLTGVGRQRVSLTIAFEMGCGVYGNEWAQWHYQLTSKGTTK